MSSIWVAVKIWAVTIFLNALFCGLLSVFTGDIFDVFLSAAILFGGFMATVPLLPLVLSLVNLSKKLPYGFRARVAWLTFYLMLLVYLFYWLLSCIDIGHFWESHAWARYLMFITITGLLIAVLTARGSLYKLYEKS
jgi:hypothetical protein